MKSKTTKKEVRENANHIIEVGYCELQRLLQYESKTHYITRAEGWAADVYFFGSIAIVTGYAPFGDIKPSRELLQKYEKQAYNIGYITSYKSGQIKYRELIDKFIKEVLK